MAQVSITVYPDTRPRKEDGRCLVKLPIYYGNKTKLYPIARKAGVSLDLTKDEFEKVYLSQKPRR